MHDRISGHVQMKMPLSDVGRMIPRMHENMVPRPTPGGGLPPPAIVSLMSGVDIHNHAPISEERVLNHIADPKSDMLVFHEKLIRR